MGRGYIHCAPVLSVTAAQKTLEAESATAQSREPSSSELSSSELSSSELEDALLLSPVVRLYGGWPGGKIWSKMSRDPRATIDEKDKEMSTNRQAIRPRPILRREYDACALRP